MCQKNQKVPIYALKMAKMWIFQKMSPPEKNCSFNVALKGANDSLCIPSDARILKYDI